MEYTWAQIVRIGAEKLAEAGVESAWHDARELAEHVRKASTHAVTRCDAACELERMEFFRLLQRRRHREPLQHIIGTMWFRYLELESIPDVFIVRPETEMVAQAGIDILNKHLNEAELAGLGTTGAGCDAYTCAAGRKPADQPLIAVDLFSGSGAIALSIATEINHYESSEQNKTQLRTDTVCTSTKHRLDVYGVEASRTAYESAQRNNSRYGQPVTFIHADACTVLPDPYEQLIAGKAALVIANPPYVPPYHQLSLEVQADPAQALFGGGAQGLDIPYAAIDRACEMLAPGGTLIMEHASEQAEPLRAAAARAGFTSISTGQDLTGADRWLCATMPSTDRSV